MANKRKLGSKINQVLPINIEFPQPEKVAPNLARSLLPGLQGILNQTEINKLDGSLRRGDISVLQSPSILKKLDDMRSGKLNNSHDAFSRLYQFSSLLKKFPVKGDDQLCKTNGLNKFKLGEMQCEQTNHRIRNTKYFGEVIPVARQLIENILGTLGSDFLRTKVQFGPGTTVNINQRSYAETGKFFKLSDRLIVPQRQKRFLAALMSDQEGWIDTLRAHYHLNDTGRSRYQIEQLVFERHFEVVDDSYENKITFVPKNSDEHRSIGVELNGSILLQKVLGDKIRSRLYDFGLNLNSQSRNVHFARVAKTFQFATVDIANASNTLSYETVKLLIPDEWFNVLDTFRSKYGRCASMDYSTKYEMFSSMGNGFTFELESLIFYAISLATVMVTNDYDLDLAKKNVAVYGDDLIVPQENYNLLVSSLGQVGFEINDSKSFRSGNFFESCGSDFYDGTDVRPFFLKREIVTIKDAYFLCNSLLYKSIKTGNSFLFPAYLETLKLIRTVLRTPNFGPLHFYEKSKSGYRELYDDLEAVLRVPLAYAQAHGGVEFDTTLYAWKYKKWIRISIESPLSLNRQYAVQNMRYLTFLDGQLNGKVVLTGKYRFKLVRRHSSSWDGSLSRRAISDISRLFESIPN